MQIIARNLEPALRWAKDHQAQLTASNGEAAVHAFEFRLHQLQFLHCLQSSGEIQTQSRSSPESQATSSIDENFKTSASSCAVQCCVGPAKELECAQTSSGSWLGQNCQMANIQQLIITYSAPAACSWA